MRAALERGGVPGTDVQRLTAGVVCSAGVGQGVARQIALDSGRTDLMHFFALCQQAYRPTP